MAQPIHLATRRPFVLAATVEPTDPLSPARGVIRGVLLGAAVWLAAAAFFYWVAGVVADRLV